MVKYKMLKQYHKCMVFVFIWFLVCGDGLCSFYVSIGGGQFYCFFIIYPDNFLYLILIINVILISEVVDVITFAIPIIIT